jgi:hypothetical protein
MFHQSTLRMCVCLCLMHQMSNTLSDRGSSLCPSGCECSYCSGCGRKPYSDKYTMHSDTPGSFGANCSSVADNASPAASGGGGRASGLALPLVSHDVAE